MEDIFTGYRWTGLTLLHAGTTHTKVTETPVRSTGSTAFYQLGAKFTGETRVVYNGKAYCYGPGTILYLPKERRGDIPYHRTFVQSGEGAYLFFDCPTPLPTVPSILPCAGQPKIQESFLKLVRLWETGQDLEAMEVFYTLLRRIREEGIRQTNKHQDGSRLAPALTYIHQHLEADYLDPAELAALCGMTPEYFRHRFREVCGSPPLQYFQTKKCRMAERMLVGSTVPINQIARQLGFSNGNYFARFFKKHTGLTPGEYRQQYTLNL